MLSIALVGCGGGAISVPEPARLDASDVASAAAWAGATAPTALQDIRFKFRYQAEKGSTGGTGRARIAGPDSVRVDLRGPVGTFNVHALVVGDRAAWADPADKFDELVPSFPLFWAMLGTARPPAAGSGVSRYSDGTMTTWVYTALDEVVEYVRVSHKRDRLLAEVRRGGKVVGTVETVFAPNGQPKSTRLIVPRKARLDITYTSIERVDSLAANTWTPPDR